MMSVRSLAFPARGRHPGRRDDAGMAALELAILAPVIIIMLLVVVAFGRVTQGRQSVDQAAAAAARAASLTSAPSQANAAARSAATQTLAGAGISCATSTITVDVSEFRPGGQVSATVQCTADLSGMAMAGVPGHVMMQATATSPLETYRDYGSAP